MRYHGFTKNWKLAQGRSPLSWGQPVELCLSGTELRTTEESWQRCREVERRPLL